MFDITKCDEIYDLLVADGQVVAPKDVKIPPLDHQQLRDHKSRRIWLCQTYMS